MREREREEMLIHTGKMEHSFSLNANYRFAESCVFVRFLRFRVTEGFRRSGEWGEAITTCYFLPRTHAASAIRCN